MLKILIFLMALFSPVDDDFPVLVCLDADSTFSIRHIDYSELKAENKWGSVRKYLLKMNKGEFFRDYLPKKLRDQMISDTSYISINKNEEGKQVRNLRIRQFKLDQGQAVKDLLPGLSSKKNSAGLMIYKLDANSWEGSKEIWVTHLGNGIHIYAKSETELNEALKDIDETRGNPHPALKEMLKQVEGKPGLWVIMNGANSLDSNYKGTATLMAYLMNPDDESLSFVTATSFEGEEQKKGILEQRKKELMPGSGGQMMKLLKELETEVDGDLVVSRGIITSDFWKLYEQGVKKSQKEIDEYDAKAGERYEEIIRKNNAYINSPGADPEQVKLAREGLKYAEEELKKLKELQKGKQK